MKYFCIWCVLPNHCANNMLFRSIQRLHGTVNSSSNLVTLNIKRGIINSKQAIPAKPENKFNFFIPKFVLTISACIYTGGMISRTFAESLESWNIFVPEDLEDCEDEDWIYVRGSWCCWSSMHRTSFFLIIYISQSTKLFQSLAHVPHCHIIVLEK